MSEQNQENLQPISAEDLAKQQTEAVSETEAEKVEAGLEDVANGNVVDEQEVEKSIAEQEQQEEEPKEEKTPSDEGNASDENGDGKVSEDVGEDAGDSEKEPVEAEEQEPNKTEEQPKDEDIPNNDEVEELRKQVEEFQFEKEEREGVAELQAEVGKGQNEFENFEARVNQALLDALNDNKIDVNKSLDEIRQEDPAKFKVAMGYIQEAEALKQRKIAEISKKVEDVQNKLIFKRAEREFAKFDLTDEQAEVAADTFIRIMREVGIQNLKDDLKMKVSLAVGQGKLLAKGVKEAAEKVAEVAEKVEEKATEVEEAIKPETVEDKVEVAEETKKEEKPEEKVPVKEDDSVKEALAEAADDPVTNTVNGVAPNKIDDPDILSKLAQFKQGSKEQLAFYKEHYGEINRAMANYHRGV